MLTKQEIIKSELTIANSILSTFIDNDKALESIDKAADVMADSIRMGGKIIACGNGGSLCDAMHFAEELTGRYRKHRKPFPAISITNPAHITCVGNDYHFNDVYSRFVEGVGQLGDVLFVISTGGNSKNVINAADMARDNKMQVIGLTGGDGGELKDYCDIEIRVPTFQGSDRVQEIHIKIIHILIMLIENHLK